MQGNNQLDLNGAQRFESRVKFVRLEVCCKMLVGVVFVM